MRSTSSPFCVRFHPDDVKRLKAEAKRDGVAVSVWIRTAVLDRAALIQKWSTCNLSKCILPELSAGRADSYPVCFRLEEADFKLAMRAVKREKAILSTWIRAVVALRLNNRAATMATTSTETLSVPQLQRVKLRASRKAPGERSRVAG